MDASAAGLVATLRGADRDRYLCLLYAPEDKREDLAAIYAFNAEIAAIRDRVREPLPGEIRLQWWRDVLAAPDGEGAGHPLASALLGAIRRHGLPRAAFDAYLDARIFDLYDDPMPARGDLEGYCGETASALIQLSALVLAPQEAAGAAEAAGHAGCAQTIAGLLRLLPLHRARGQCFVPRDILAAAGTGPEAFVDGSDEGAAARAVEAMVALGREHLGGFLRHTGEISAALRPAFLPVAPVAAYLANVAGAPAAALKQPAGIADWRRQWIIFRAASGAWPKLKS
jgi:phytoene synthase